MLYIAAVFKDPDSDYSVFFPDFPTCITAGSTMEEAREMAHDALIGHIEVMLEYGDPVPEPSSFEDVLESEFCRTALAFLAVSVSIPETNPSRAAQG